MAGPQEVIYSDYICTDCPALRVIDRDEQRMLESTNGPCEKYSASQDAERNRVALGETASSILCQQLRRQLGIQVPKQEDEVPEFGKPKAEFANQCPANEQVKPRERVID
jgi:hypothetical protein